MPQAVAAFITGVLGLLTGTIGFYFTNRYLEQRRQSLATKRDQLQSVFAALEILLKMNRREFDRYFEDGTVVEDRIFIEKHVWHPNNVEIKRILMEKSHLLNEIPEEFLKLLIHINVWLTE